MAASTADKGTQAQQCYRQSMWNIISNPVSQRVKPNRIQRHKFNLPLMDLRRLEKVISTDNQEIVQTIGGYPLFHTDIATLREGKWINAQVINTY